MQNWLKSFFYAAILCCGSMTFGSIIAFGSATLRIIKVTFGPLSTFTVGAFQAAPAFIGIFAPIFWNYLMKRKRLKICASIVGLSGAVFWLLLLTMNKNYFWLTIVFRGFLGTTLAGVSAICPMYLGQIAPPEKKGLFGTFHIIFIVVGHIVSNLLGVTHKWQPPIYTCAAFMLIFGTGVYLIPDNQTKVRHEYDGNDSSFEEVYEEDDNEVQLKNARQESEKESSQMSLFDKSIRKQAIVSMLLLLLMQLSGIGSIMQNIAPMMSEVGLDIDAGYQATIAICAQLISSVLSSMLIDKYGCRILWLVSSFGSFASLLLYGLNVKFGWSRWLPMILLFVFQFVFGIGMGPVPWIVPTHVFPPQILRNAISLGTSCTWFASSIVVFLFPFLQKWFGQFGLMMILTGVNFISFLVGFFFLNDYSRKTLMISNETNQEISDIE